MQTKHELIPEPIGLDVDAIPRPLNWHELYGNDNPVELEIGRLEPGGQVGRAVREAMFSRRSRECVDDAGREVDRPHDVGLAVGDVQHLAVGVEREATADLAVAFFGKLKQLPRAGWGSAGQTMHGVAGLSVGVSHPVVVPGAPLLPLPATMSTSPVARSQR